MTQKPRKARAKREGQINQKSKSTPETIYITPDRMNAQGRSAAEVAAATAATLNTLMATTSNNTEDKKAAKVGGSLPSSVHCPFKSTADMPT